MQRFLLFVWDQYYPTGGMNDLVASFATGEEAVEQGATLVSGNNLKWYQVYDIVEGVEFATDCGVWED